MVSCRDLFYRFFVSNEIKMQLARYLRKLVAKKDDPTLMTQEEFFAKLERGEEEFRQGKTYRMLPGENLDDFLKRVG